MSEFGVDLTIDSVARHARREAFREAVEALRELAETESGEAATALRGAALLLAARLSPDNGMVPRDVAERAVLDAVERRTREIVEALREIIVGNGTDHDPYARGMTDAADFIERTFLSPDNPEGNA